jgi:hypothetical protein
LGGIDIDVGDYDLRPAAAEAMSDSFANPSGRTGNDGRLSV